MKSFTDFTEEIAPHGMRRQVPFRHGKALQTLSARLVQTPARFALAALAALGPDQLLHHEQDAFEIVDLLSCLVTQQNESRLTKAELALLLFLAIHPTGASKIELGEALSPLLEPDAFARSLKVLVHRLRAKVGADTIVTVRGGYRLKADCVTDLRAVEIFARRADPGRSQHRARARGYYARLQRRRIQHDMKDWPWFDPTERRLHDLEIALGLFLARASLDADESERAMLYAQDVVAMDPYDERAREIIIRAHLTAGRLGAARAELRQFAAVMPGEQAQIPIANLRHLIEVSDRPLPPD